MKFFRDKRGSDAEYSELIFIILNILFFGLVFFFVGRVGSGVTVTEQLYAKQIALIIDSAKPGTSVVVDISELYELAKKNKFSGNVFNIDFSKNEISVKVAKGKGYSFKYFNKIDPEVSIDGKGEALHINF